MIGFLFTRVLVSYRFCNTTNSCTHVFFILRCILQTDKRVIENKLRNLQSQWYFVLLVRRNSILIVRVTCFLFLLIFRGIYVRCTRVDIHGVSNFSRQTATAYSRGQKKKKKMLYEVCFVTEMLSKIDTWYFTVSFSISVIFFERACFIIGNECRFYTARLLPMGCFETKGLLDRRGFIWRSCAAY